MRALFLLAMLTLGCRTDDSGDPKLDDTAPEVLDADGDGWPEGEDCDDHDAAINPDAEELCDGLDNDCDGELDEDATDAATWYADADSDGYGDPATTVTTCDQGDGWVTDASDCDDSDADTHPGADEYCNGVDDDCDGDIDEADALDASLLFPDADGDGYGDAEVEGIACCACPSGYVEDNTDCDDGDADTHPGAEEYCDGVDRDCNGTVDDDYAVDATIWYADADGDGYGDAAVSVTTCAAGSGHVTDATDCDDTDASVHPGADEYCNGVDDDCDGVIDEDDAVDTTRVYPDDDGDGYGDITDAGIPCCGCPSGYVSDHSDCDDGDASVYPGADEYCDGVDSDCDGTLDEDDALDATTWYEDADGDGYGNASVAVTTCLAASGWVADNTDCDDGDASVYPGADEYCNGIDDDCDGDIDEDDALDTLDQYEDRDGDGYGGALAGSWCYQLSAYVLDHTDCDDADAAVYPGADEYCDGVDSDCNGTPDDDYALDVTTWYADADGDGYGDAAVSVTSCAAGSGHVTDSNDCDDTDAAVNPGADEYCNGVDDDCDGDIDEDDALDTLDQYEDRDGDGYGGALAGSWCELVSAYVIDHSDCDDYDATVYPGADESCDSIDSDCDGSTDDGDEVDAATWYADTDLDGYGDAGSTATACEEPSGYTDTDTDCDDSDADINPGASEACNGLDDDCDGTVDEDSAVGGDSADCPADDCAAILAARPSATDGTYWVDPAGSGTVIELLCEMDIDGGGWTQARDAYLAELGTASREYLYSKGSAWYLSPATDLIWDWSSYQVLEGTYYYSTGSEWAEGSFACTHGESGHWGIGCSNGGGHQWKVLPWGSGQDSDAATCPICQDQPDVFGAGACASGVSIWVR